MTRYRPCADAGVPQRDGRHLRFEECGSRVARRIALNDGALKPFDLEFEHGYALGKFRGRQVVDRLADRMDRRLGGRGAENLVVEPGHRPLLHAPTASLVRGARIIGRFPSPPNRRAVTVSDNWNGDACQLTDKARFRVPAPTRLTDLDLWYNWRQGETAPAFMLTTGDNVVAQGQLARGACDPIQAAWCNAHAQIAVDAAPGNYEVMTPDARVCMNARSHGIGFARVKGLQ